MKKTYVALFLSICYVSITFAQEMVLKKGAIMENLPINDSISETFSLYLPTYFDTNKEWPLLLVFDLQAKEKQALSMFLNAAEEEGYVLAAPKILDSISLSANMVTTDATINRIFDLLPIQKQSIYGAGASSGARFANLVPIFIRKVKGAISIGSSVANTELFNAKQPFHFIGIVGKDNFNYTSMLAVEKILDRLRFPNQILLHEGKGDWPDLNYLKKSLQLFKLAGMAKNYIPKDSIYIESAYQEDLIKVGQLKNMRKLLLAEQYMGEMMSMYGPHKNLDSLRLVLRDLRRDKIYRSMKRSENTAFLKESLLKEDYQYYMDEDFVSHNFNNLGWWNYQFEEINKFISGTDVYEKEMGHRLLGFINALAIDNINYVQSQDLIDEDALAFLYMLKTILEPNNFDYYLKVVSLSSKNEDYGTALFYLEEALKNGFKDKEKLYGLEDTALFRITPEFNKLVSKYLKDARYEIIEE
ncbi:MULTISPECIES: alpha/beta hydrolase [Flavobacteriaceae]|uniref:alpha/beta hydrolase n=1 Tax=Flavobacteriaceae TaxID=49546 RepID=UPI001491B631|nr:MULTISPECIES: alpha/beta hydrolase [Allomuricauda]MDC6367371.1 alpha/beta hydrolase [Muricauda sp. AC10]